MENQKEAVKKNKRRGRIPVKKVAGARQVFTPGCGSMKDLKLNGRGGTRKEGERGQIKRGGETIKLVSWNLTLLAQTHKYRQLIIYSGAR